MSKDELLDKLIQVDPEICHGQPCFAGTRIMVWQVLEMLETDQNEYDNKEMERKQKKIKRNR